MRKPIYFIAILCMAIALLISNALAVEQYELLPVDVIQHPERLEIHKIYEMATSIDPACIPRDGFERDGVVYSCADILREVVIGDETITHTETETIETAKNDIETVLSLLPPTKDATTEDGFSGTLYLDIASIASEVSGYGSRSSTATITRNYPNLSDADTQYIPKTQTEGNKTYTLEGIQWQTYNTHNVDDYEIGSRYTATATYSGTVTSSYVKGCNVTADYTGELCRTGVSVIRYTVIFAGTKTSAPQQEPEPAAPPEPEPEQTPDQPVEEPEPEPEPEPVKHTGFNWLYAVLPLSGVLAGAAGTCIYFKNKKERTNNAKNNDYDYADTYIDNSGGNTGAGS